MNRCSSSANSAILHEYRKAADALFPPAGFLPGQEPDIKAVRDFANVLGIETDYLRLLALDKHSGEMRLFLEHFQNNLDLLIRKTWVEEADEERKGKLQDGVSPFMTTIEREDYFKALEEFGGILDELAYLFFGDQSEKDDFTEYTFRIDAQMGLFWWYGGRLASLKAPSEKNSIHDKQVLWAVLLLGICYLTNF